MNMVFKILIIASVVLFALSTFAFMYVAGTFNKAYDEWSEKYFEHLENDDDRE